MDEVRLINETWGALSRGQPWHGMVERPNFLEVLSWALLMGLLMMFCHNSEKPCLEISWLSWTPESPSHPKPSLTSTSTSRHHLNGRICPWYSPATLAHCRAHHGLGGRAVASECIRVAKSEMLWSHQIDRQGCEECGKKPGQIWTLSFLKRCRLLICSNTCGLKQPSIQVAH